MDEVEKYKRFRICCCKPLKDKYRLMKTGRLTVEGEAVVTATQLSIAGERSLCRMCYLTVLIVQKRLRMSTPGHALCEIRFLVLTRSFKLETSKWSLEPTETLSASDGSLSSQKEIHCH